MKSEYNILKFERPKTDLSKMNRCSIEMIQVPGVDLPFLKKTDFCEIDKEELLRLIKKMCASGLYRMPKNLESASDLTKFLEERPTFCLRTRDYMEAKEKDSRVAV